MAEPDVSIVVPVYNEEDNLRPLADQIVEAMRGTGKSYECILVDDGSDDGSAEVIAGLCGGDRRFRGVYFRRNFGQTAALTAGFDHARGRIVITADADLQNDPADIPMLIEKIGEGYDLVSGWRKDRKDSWIRNLPSFIANKMISSMTKVRIHDSGCTLKAYRREILEDLHLYGEMHRFIPALASWRGVRILEVPVRHHARRSGKSKYGFSRVFRVLLDMVTVKFLLSYSASPIQMFGKIGLLTSFGGWLLFLLAVILKIVQERTLTGNPLFYAFAFAQILAVQFILIGLLAEMSMRIYHESQKKKTYVVRRDPPA